MVDTRTSDSPDPPISTKMAPKKAPTETRFATSVLHMRQLQQLTTIVSLASAHWISVPKRKNPKPTQDSSTSEFSMQSESSTTLLQSSQLTTALPTAKTFHQEQTTKKCSLISGLTPSPSDCTFYSHLNQRIPFLN